MEQVIYTSRLLGDERESLTRILEQSRANNAESGLTDILLHQEDSFLQVLEGPDEAVSQTWEKIRRDDRHDQIRLLVRRKVEERIFKDWKMGLLRLENVEDDELESVSEFLRTGVLETGTTTSEDTGMWKARVLDVLEGFRRGRWRTRVER